MNSEVKRLNFITTENLAAELDRICERKGKTKTECLNEALLNFVSQTEIKDNGGMVLPIFNPQEKAEPTKGKAMEVFLILCELKKLDLDTRLCTGGAFKQIEKFLYNRLVAENAEDGLFLESRRTK